MGLKITPIGSCRIVDPLRRARAAYGFEMNRDRSTGFTHTSPEAVQQLKFLRGEIDIPEELWTYVSNVDRAETIARRHDPADLYVVELCSEKILSLGGTYLQLNYLRTQFKDFFSENHRKNGYWKAISQSGQDGIDAFLKATWDGSDDQKREAEILRQVRLGRADEEQTRRDIRYLADELPRVIFVTHVNATDKSGELIQSRDRYIRMVKDIATEEGCVVFDPTDSMAEVGQDAALEPDLNHYLDDFKDRIVADWYAREIPAMIEDMITNAGEDAVERILAPFVLARAAEGAGDTVQGMMHRVGARLSGTPAFDELRSRFDAG